MEWRCEWCGKPHEDNDPPCDNCGHGKFEKAIVRQRSVGDVNSTTVWVCTDCGREHTKHSPPCSRCNNATLEKQEKTVTDADLTKRPGDGGTIERLEAETTTVWVCTDCGREHTKHAAACKECNNTDLEHTEKRISEDELAAPSYLELLTPTYVAVLGVVLLIAAVSVLGFAGIIDVPFITNSVPDVEDVPGSEEETASGISLTEVESAHIDALNERRAANGLDSLDRDDRLDEIATFRNQQTVKAAVEGDRSILDDDTFEELVLDECQEAVSDADVVTAEQGDDATTLGGKFSQSEAGTEGERYDSVGIDIHAVGDDLYLTIILCVS